jgi:CelD/BcsL family acetyltransferase involved in cellulose biosynthesis
MQMTAPPAEIMPLASLGDARKPWIELAERAGNIFSTWEWAKVWWDHFGAGKKLDIALLSRNGRSIGVLPMAVQRHNGITVSRFIGHGVADQLGPVCDPTDVSAVTAGLSSMRSHAIVLVAERMTADHDWPARLGGTLITKEFAPVIDLASEDSWDSYLGARSANFRQQARRRARKLHGLGVRFRLADNPAQLESDFGALRSLHAARWGAASAFDLGAPMAFHRDFAAVALEQGWLRLWLAEVDGVAVAAWYGFRFAGVESYYQSGRDPSWDRFRVGAGILEHSIREAFADGMREYRLLRGDEDYKHRYLSREESISTIACGRTPLGRAAVAALRLRARSKAVRRRRSASADGDASH